MMLDLVMLKYHKNIMKQCLCSRLTMIAGEYNVIIDDKEGNILLNKDGVAKRLDLDALIHLIEERV